MSERQSDSASERPEGTPAAGKKPRKGGRLPLLVPSTNPKRNPGPFEKLLTTLATGASERAACAVARIHYSTLMSWKARARADLASWAERCNEIRSQAEEAEDAGRANDARRMWKTHERELQRRPVTRYVEFLDHLHRAMDEAEVVHVGLITRGAHGQPARIEWHEETITKTAPDGTVTATHKRKPVVVQYAEPGQWKASAWLLERRRRSKYGREQVVKHGVDGNMPENAVFELKLGTVGTTPRQAPGSAPNAPTQKPGE